MAIFFQVTDWHLKLRGNKNLPEDGAQLIKANLSHGSSTFLHTLTLGSHANHFHLDRQRAKMRGQECKTAAFTQDQMYSAWMRRVT